MYLWICICVFEYLTVGNISFDVLGPWAFQKYSIIRFYKVFWAWWRTPHKQPGEPSASLLVEHWAKQTFAKIQKVRGGSGFEIWDVISGDISFWSAMHFWLFPYIYLPRIEKTKSEGGLWGIWRWDWCWLSGDPLFQTLPRSSSSSSSSSLSSKSSSLKKVKYCNGSSYYSQFVPIN